LTRHIVKRVAIAANLQKDSARAILKDLVRALSEHEIEAFLDDDLAGEAPALTPACAGTPDDCDVIVAVGGDGTILKYARRYLDRGIPIVGVKGGRLGFLAEADPLRVVGLLDGGQFVVQERMRVRGDVVVDGATARSFSALNDLVIHSTGYSRMVGLRVTLGGKLLREFSADGLIIASPTGSTAYSLSAGGPILEPTMRAIVLTPLNPHTMSMRPMVLDHPETVSVEVISAPSGVMMTVDGQEGMEIPDGYHVEAARDNRSTRLIVADDYDFFALLREKL
jgi:NAD+ kinase